STTTQHTSSVSCSCSTSISALSLHDALPIFLRAIPQTTVGCSRVTHPYATLMEKQAPPISFDLHVLGLPLAFILSQDQTLHCKMIVRPDPITQNLLIESVLFVSINRIDLV